MKIIVTEKPSVARDYAKVLGVSGPKQDGFIANNEWIITWCVGHLITLNNPEDYDEALKQWRMDTLPIIPANYKYHVIADVAHQFNVIKALYHRADVDTIYYAGDAGREGVYIQMLVRQEAGTKPGVDERIVWIDSYTDDEIKRGIREAQPISSRQDLIDSAYMRAIEDWLLGMNFSRGLTIRYANLITSNRKPIAVGRVMTAVLGMVVRRELEIKNFVSVPFYRIQSVVEKDGQLLTAGWKCTENSPWFNSNKLYDASGFKTEADAKAFIATLPTDQILVKDITSSEKKKYAPSLFNLAELQIECSRLLHITPSQTLEIAQSLYEKKMTTYPRTDARVLSSAVARVISTNLNGLRALPGVGEIVDGILNPASIEKTKYTNDAAISDHYAIIPTGFNVGAYNSLSATEQQVYKMIVKRFLSIFLPPAIYKETKITEQAGDEIFTVSGSVLVDPGYMTVAGIPNSTSSLPEAWNLVKPGDYIGPVSYAINAGETKPPKRYTEGSIVDAMENAGKMIEDEDLRDQIKGSGIGTSATRAATLEKLKKMNLIKSEKKTLILSPTTFGFRNYEVILHTVPNLLNPEMTANWERDLTEVAEGRKTKAAYEQELNTFIKDTVDQIRNSVVTDELRTAISKYPDDESVSGSDSNKPAFKVNAECYLSVPWDDKDLVKSLGARWDGERKSWYVPKGKDPAPFQKWVVKKAPPKASSIRKIFINVPFEDKDAAKSVGARWDGDNKSWYYPSNLDKNLFAKWAK